MREGNLWQGNSFINEKTSEPTEEEYEIIWHTIRSYWYITIEVISCLTCIAGIAASLFFIFIVMRFKRLRTRPSYYLLNIAIINIIYLSFRPFYFLVLTSSSRGNLPQVCVCLFFDFEKSALFTIFIFICLMALDWYYVNYHKRFVQCYLKHYRFIIGLAYSIGFIRCIIIVVNQCFHGNPEAYQVLLEIYLINVIILVVLNILKCVSSSDALNVHDSKYSIVVANVLMLSWMPLSLYSLIFRCSTSIIIRRILAATMFIPDIISALSIIVLLCVLGRLDGHFKMAYGRTFKRNFPNDDLNRNSEDEAVVEYHVHAAPELINTYPVTA